MAGTSPFNQSDQLAFRSVDRVRLGERQRVAWESQIEQIRQDFRRQHRRLGTPMSQREVRNPAIGRVVDQIRILLRVVDSELLKYDTDSQPVLPPQSLRSLLQLNGRWADRLENQIWLLEDNLEHGQQLNRLLSRLFVDGEKAFCAIDEFAHGFTDRVIQVPESSLLIPEPGLILAEELSSRVENGAAALIARALQTTRLLAWTQNQCRPLSIDRRKTILFALLRDAGMFAIDPRFRNAQTLSTLDQQTRQMVANLVSRWRHVPSGLSELLTHNGDATRMCGGGQSQVIEAITRLVDLMEFESVELAKKNVLADTKTAFGSAIRQLLKEASAGRFDVQQVRTLLTTLDLSAPALNEHDSKKRVSSNRDRNEPELNERGETPRAGLAERLLLFSRLRRHGSHQPPQVDAGESTSSIPRPKFLRRESSHSRISIDVPHRQP